MSSNRGCLSMTSTSPTRVRGRRKVFVGVRDTFDDLVVVVLTPPPPPPRFGEGVANATGMLGLAPLFPSTTVLWHGRRATKGMDG
jgi:hypothetical protein